MTSITQKKQLLRKYNVPAPRYTSYPTVPYWDDNPNEQQWLELLSQSLREARDQKVGAAIYLHIPFCESLCTFCGCNTRITKNHAVSNLYIDLIHREWDLYRQKLGFSDQIEVGDLHLGGGTPTFLNVDELKKLLEPILDQFTQTPHSEFSLEVDPRVTSREQLSYLHSVGFNRVSMGVQDFAPAVQEIVNRIQPLKMVKNLTEVARELGFKSVNYDLIYGLPLQTESSMSETFKHVVDLRPDRVAFYAYAHVPWIKPAHRRFSEADLPSPEEKRRLYELGREILESAGYLEVGMDHFALPTDGLWNAVENKTLHRNFMGYIPTHVSPLLGLGVSAISDSWTAFIQNEKSLEKYRARLYEGQIPILRGHLLTREDQILRRHILNLMTRFETTWEPHEVSDVPFLNAIPEKLAELVSDQLIMIEPNSVKILESGRPFIRNIGMAFDARLARKAPQTSLFSSSI